MTLGVPWANILPAYICYRRVFWYLPYDILFIMTYMFNYDHDYKPLVSLFPTQFRLYISGFVLPRDIMRQTLKL